MSSGAMKYHIKIAPPYYHNKKETSHSIALCKEPPEFLANRVVLTWSRLILDATDGEDIVIRF